MTMKRRVRRALLFCPGTEERKITKAAGADVDSVIIDLEDAAALDKKEEARQITAECLRKLSFGRSERLVRVNPVGTGLTEADLRVTGAAESLPDGYVIPKVGSGDDVRHVAAIVEELEREAGREPGSVRLLAIIESALGVVHLREIANASDRLDALIFGAEDLCGDIGATRSPGGTEVLYARSAVVIHAAAASLDAIDTPYVDLRDIEGLSLRTKEAAAAGFSGKLAIHPAQIEPIQQAFTPTAEEVARARELIEAHEAHQAQGIGVFSLHGKMVDMPMVRAAERVLARSSAGDQLPR
ncbi:MAG: CoA ester lyase [Myxococcales bacterium]|nr:CoA ester lyase [Myxococcales bacterium]